MQLSQGVERDRLALGRAQAFKAFGSLLQLGIESADAEPDQRCFHSIDDPILLSDKAFALAVGPLGIFVLDCRDRYHLAVITLAAQPAENGDTIVKRRRGVSDWGATYLYLGSSTLCSVILW